MPTKRNKADQQQPYVPAGNGDASGEYADHESGSNKHFTNFKKPEEMGEVEYQDNFSVVKDDKPSIETKSFDDYIKNNFKDSDFGKGLKYSFDCGNDENKQLVNTAIKNGVNITKTKGIANYSGSVNLANNDIGEIGNFSQHAPGSTFYHEFWHCFDETYGSGTVDITTGEPTIQKLITEEDIKHVLANSTSSKRRISGFSFNVSAMTNAAVMSRELSTGKVLSNGKTLYETIKDECKQLSKRKDGVRGWYDIEQDFNNELKNAVLQKYPNWQEKQIRMNEIESLTKNFLINGGYREYTKEFNDAKRNKLAEIEEYQTLKGDIEKVDSFRSKQRTELVRSWVSISDMYGIHNKVPYGFCGGHTGNYSSRIPGAIAKEFLAEFGSAKSRKDKYAIKELELFKKYFPESSKMCEELCNMVIEHNKRGGKF